MIPADRLVAFAAVAFVLIVVPGPSVLFVISRGVALGRQAALATVVGNELGLTVQVAAVAAGLGAVVERSVVVYTAVKLVGAGYLVFLGVQAIRHRRQLPAELTSAAQPRNVRRIVRDGFVVGVANPKTIIFLGAILPQFTDPTAGPAQLQLLVLGALFVAMAFVLDGIWGLVAGTARNWLSGSPRRLSALGGTGGVVMVALGARMLTTARTD